MLLCIVYPFFIYLQRSLREYQGQAVNTPRAMPALRLWSAGSFGKGPITLMLAKIEYI